MPVIGSGMFGYIGKVIGKLKTLAFALGPGMLASSKA